MTAPVGSVVVNVTPALDTAALEDAVREAVAEALESVARALRVGHSTGVRYVLVERPGRGLSRGATELGILDRETGEVAEFGDSGPAYVGGCLTDLLLDRDGRRILIWTGADELTDNPYKETTA